MQAKHNPELVPFAKELRKKDKRRAPSLVRFLRAYPIRFSRQKVLGRYIVDFYCAEAKLVIELDGSQHYEEYGRKKMQNAQHFLNAMACRLFASPIMDSSEIFKEYVNT